MRSIRAVLGAGLCMGACAVASAATSVATFAADCEAGFEQVLHAAPAAMATLDARAVWLNRSLIRWPGARAGARFRLLHSARGQIVAQPGQRASGADGAIKLAVQQGDIPAALLLRFKWLAAGPTLAWSETNAARIAALHTAQLVLVQEDEQGRVEQATATQIAGALDDLHAAAEQVSDLGAAPSARRTRFKLWAPTAQAAALCLHHGTAKPQLLPMRRETGTGVWQAGLPQDLSGWSYTYLVDVHVRGRGLVRNRVTDPYSQSLTADSARSWVVDLNAKQLQPPGWSAQPRPGQNLANTDLAIYELHLRDFSLSDPLVPEAQRGKYLAFTQSASHGMRHLRALAQAGLTDVHLLPVFDIASIPERGCTTPDARALAALDPAGEQQQALVMKDAPGDCFNWGYDPLHYTAPEGSYASNADNGDVRVLEFRRMVQALHEAGLRVGMDVVYNHTPASGQKPKSVLDRIVPGYYQRLNAKGDVETSTCCDNTATEHLMMGKLMMDSVVVWARDHAIDSFRFDLMGHQPREVMERLQAAVDKAAGRHIHLIGEGWNFGEIANGARFVQASQASLNGSGIGSFSDRARDAARGGGCCDNAAQTAARPSWLGGTLRDAKTADLIRVGLAGTLKNYRMTTYDGSVKALSEIDYAGQGAGFASQPGETVNYVENHDNQTLFDLLAIKLPHGEDGTSREDRARVQLLGLALTAFSQGVAYFHAGSELLRSKSGDRNSYDSGDWFNRLDFTLADNGWGAGLPPKQDNQDFWPLLKPLLADARIKPGAADIRFVRDAFMDLLTIRASSSAFRLRSAEAVQQRLTMLNTGPQQDPLLIAAHLNASGLAGGGFDELVVVINAGASAAALEAPSLRGKVFVPHPVHLAAAAADQRPARESDWDTAAGRFTVPPRTAMVWVAAPGSLSARP